jgi:oligopeptide/dipeptide ABC transporter ATP-binding protein
MVFQHPMSTLNPVMPVGRQIVEAIRAVRPVRRDQARRDGADLLGEMGIRDAARRLDDYPHEFSGGQRQRIVIAIALAGEPALLLADEPTSALDVTTQASILKMFARIKSERGTAIVLVSHNYAVVSQLCRRTVVLYAGQIAEHGPTASVLRAPAHPYTAGLIECLPSPDARRASLPVIPGEPPAADAGTSGCPFAPRCRHRLDECVATPMRLRSIGAKRETACIRVGDDGKIIDGPRQHNTAPQERRVFS